MHQEFPTLDVGSFATTFHNIRPRLAWSGASADADGCRRSIDSSRNQYPLGRTSNWSIHTEFDRGRCWSASSRWIMDALRGSNSGIDRAMANSIAARRPVDPHPVGNRWRCLGSYRTWRLVGRRSPFWMEAHRYSNSKELAFTLLRMCLPTRKSAQESQYIVSARGSIWGFA